MKPIKFKDIVILIIILLFPIFNISGIDKPTVAVLDFSVNNISERDMKSITEFISVSFFETDKFAVIDTSQRDTILKELNFSISGCSDEECQLEIGKLLSAEYIIVGNISLIGSRYLVTAKMLVTESSLTVKTGKGMYEDLNSLLDGVDELVADLTDTDYLHTEKPQEVIVEASDQMEDTEIPAEENPEQPKPKFNINRESILPLSLAAVSAGAIGAGIYFLIDADNYYTSIYLPALDAYNNAPAATSETDFNLLWTQLETSAKEKNIKTIIGYSCTAAGITAGIFSTILFIKNAENRIDEKGTAGIEQLMFRPAAGGFMISVGWSGR